MIDFRVKAHSLRPGNMVEVLRDGELIATIYGGDVGAPTISSNCISVVSRLLSFATIDQHQPGKLVAYLEGPHKREHAES